MIFKTKYNCGDMVWFMHDNRPLEVEISRIKIYQDLTQIGLTTIVEYMVKFIHSTGCESDKWFNSNLFYKTKKELVESL